jgi:hypothetical protein
MFFGLDRVKGGGVEPSEPRQRNGQRKAGVRRAAPAAGALLLLLGCLGFIPGVTTNYANLRWIGQDSTALLLGVFQVSILQNLVHAVTGAAGFLLSGSVREAKTYLTVAGAFYLLMGVFGLIVSYWTAANLMAANTAGSILHLALSAALLASGILLSAHGGHDRKARQDSR